LLRKLIGAVSFQPRQFAIERSFSPNILNFTKNEFPHGSSMRIFRLI